jgi:hypothetical protein
MRDPYANPFEGVQPAPAPRPTEQPDVSIPMSIPE